MQDRLICVQLHVRCAMKFRSTRALAFRGAVQNSGGGAAGDLALLGARGCPQRGFTGTSSGVVP
jgi:hypothetical protein